MINVEDLDALDLLIWLGRGEDAARYQGCNQSTISRRCQTVLRTFDLRLKKDAEGWPCTRQQELMQGEREVHQWYRLRTGQPLRLDASLLAAPLLRLGTPNGWWRGPLDEVGWQRPLHLLKQRILDAWICGMAQELPRSEQAWFVAVPLLKTPLRLALPAGDPLLLETGLRLDDLAGLPRLAPRSGHYPRTEAELARWCQVQQPRLMELQARRPRVAPAGRVLHYGTSISLLERPELCPLPMNLGVTTESCLVVHRELIEQPRLQELLAVLQQRASHWLAQSSRVAAR